MRGISNKGLERPGARRRMLTRALLAFGVSGDIVAVNLAMVLAYWLRFRSGWIAVPKGEPLSRHAYLGAMVAVTVVWLLVFQACDMYRPQRWSGALDEAYRVLIAATGVFVTIMAMSFLYRSFEYSRLTAGIAYVIAVVLVASGRGLGLQVQARVQSRPGFRRRVALLGVDDLAPLLPEDGREIVFATDGAQGARAVLHRLEAGELEEVILSRCGLPEELVLDLLRACEEAGAEAVLAPDRVDLLLARGGWEEVAGVPLVRVRDAPLSGAQRAIKRLFDIVVAAFVLVVGAPLMGILAVAVRRSSPGPVLFRQTRITEGGRAFTMLKFRTMQADAEAKTGPVWTTRGDPRITPVGAFLRKTSADELPQFWNVLVGDMSLIGPRPERPEFVEQFALQVPRYQDRHRMKTGITGWAQVNDQRGDVGDIESRTRYDLFYVDNWSLMLDLQILVKTAFEVLFQPGAV